MNQYKKVVLFVMLPALLLVLMVWAVTMGYIQASRGLVEFVHNYGWIICVGALVVPAIVLTFSEGINLRGKRVRKKLVRAEAERLRGQRRTCIKFYPRLNTKGPMGCSKVYGVPDMAGEFDWPVAADGHPMTFFLQIRCADLAPLDPEGHYPHEGMMYLFVWYDDGKLVYAPTEKSLRPVTPPDGAFSMEGKAIKFRLANDYPTIGDNLNILEQNAVGNILGDYFDEEMYGHLGGYEEELFAPASSRLEPVKNNANDYELLICMSGINIEWDVEGWLNCFIRREDLRHRDFNRVLFDWQD